MAHYIPMFSGANYKFEPHLIEDSQAQDALNCFFENGALKSFRDVSHTDSARPGVKTLYRFADAYWFQWSRDVDVAKGQIPGDTEDRTYFTGDGVPKMTFAGPATSGGSYPGVSYTLGIPSPEAPTATVKGEPDSEEDIAESRAYVVTYVSQKGEEGPPSYPTSLLTLKPGQYVEVSNLPPAPSGSYLIDTLRIYRTATAAGNTDYQFVAEIPVASNTYEDTLAAENLGELLPTIGWVAPPEDMEGLVALPNGIMAGFRGKDLCFSEPYYPHAWPLEYRLQTDYPIVAIAPFSGGVVVATTGTPYVVSADHPAAASMQKVERPRACVSKRGMVDMGQYAIFPTADGLLLVAPGQAPSLITDPVLTREQWRRLNPETIHAYRWHNRYVAFYQGQDGDGGFMLSPQDGELTFISLYADAGFSDPKTGDLFLAMNGVIYRWDAASTYMTYQWTSKVFLEPRRNAMTTVRVDAESYPIAVQVLADDGVVETLSVTDSRAHRIMPRRGKRWWLYVEGTHRVRTITLAQSAPEAI